MDDQAQTLRIRMNQHVEGPAVHEPSPHRVIAVASGKGGVGKSNFVVNFALGLAQKGYHPIVIDADVGFANVEVLLGARPTRSIKDILEGHDVWSVVQESSCGLPFLSGGNGLFDIHSLSDSQIDTLLQELLRLHDKYDVILIDSGSGMGENMGRVLTAADDLIVVTTPEPTAITDAYALMKLLVIRGDMPRTHIVVNRVNRLVDGRITANKVQMVAKRFLHLEPAILGFVLEDDTVGEAVMKQEALLSAFPKSPAARCVHQIVSNYLLQESDLTPVRRGLAGFFERVFRRLYSESRDTSNPA